MSENTLYTFDTDEQVVAAGERIERARYWDMVRRIAQEAIAECPEDEEERDKYVWQDVDGNQYIIYTAKNLDVLRFTENDSAYEDAGIVLDDTKNAYHVYQQVAFYAMRQDVMDEIARALIGE